MVGSGPYTPTTYIPGKTVVLDRNPNWDPATDPLRKAWVDRIQIKLDVSISSIQRAIEREEADLSLDSHVPQARVAALRADPERSRRLSVNTTGSLLFLVLETHPKAGAIADVRVRRAVNYAIDKVAYRDAIAGRCAATGELASTILAPGSLGYRPYDLYPTPGGRGDPVKAKALLAEAGYPNGLTLGFATLSSGRLAAGRKPIEESLARAGIRLKVTTNEPGEPHFEALGIHAKRLEHQLAQSGWVPDYLGDNARQTIVPQYDSRLPDAGNFSEYHNPAVNRLIDRALAEPDRDRRAAMWAGIDQQIMRDAPLVPLVWEKASFQWAPRVHGWVYDPWTTRARPHRRVAGPPEPLTAPALQRPSRRGDRSQQVPGGVPAVNCPGRVRPRHRSALLTALAHRVVRVRPVLGDRRVVAGRGRPPQAAARRAGLEFVEKLLTRTSPARTRRSGTQSMLRRVPLRRIGRVGYRLRLTSHIAAWRGEVNRSRCAWASSGRTNNSAISACRAACVLAAQPTGWWGAHQRHGGSVEVCAPSARRVNQSRAERARTRRCTTQRG